MASYVVNLARSLALSSCLMPVLNLHVMFVYTEGLRTKALCSILQGAAK